MAAPKPPVLGVSAPRPRPTIGGAFWLAALAGVPVFVLLGLAELVWRLVR